MLSMQQFDIMLNGEKSYNTYLPVILWPLDL